MWTRAELKDNAKRFFKFNYWKMVLAALVMTMVGGGGVSFGGSARKVASSDLEYSSRMTLSETAALFVGIMVCAGVLIVLAYALCAFLLNPLIVGAQRFFVVSHYQKAELGELGYSFSNSYMNIVKTMFLKDLFVFLWSLLLIVPGIIKEYEYRMIPYILAENPGIYYKDAFAMSKRMMYGNKWNAFVLDLSFVGWNILSLFTCGILAVFYVNPYQFMTNAELYVALKEITFGGYGGGYQAGPGFQNNRDYQGWQQNQGWQGYQQGQNAQEGQQYQGWQGYQQGQNAQEGQQYQGWQGYQQDPYAQDEQRYRGQQDDQDGERRDNDFRG